MQDVLVDGRQRRGRASSPGVGQHEPRWCGRNDDARPRDGGGDRRCAGLIGPTGLVLLGRGAAGICLHLREGLSGANTGRAPLVHRAGLAVAAARHACFRRCDPAGADRPVAGRHECREGHCEESPAEGQHPLRMLDPAAGVKKLGVRQPAVAASANNDDACDESRGGRQLTVPFCPLMRRSPFAGAHGGRPTQEF